MKMYLLAFTIFLSLNAAAANYIYSSTFTIHPEYMNIENGAPIYLGDISFEARFIPGNGSCGIYYKNRKIECSVGTSNFGAALGFFMKSKIVFNLIQTELPEGIQKNRALEILSLVKHEQLILLGHFARPLGAQGFVWRFYENSQQFTDPASKTEYFQLNVAAEDLKILSHL